MNYFLATYPKLPKALITYTLAELPERVGLRPLLVMTPVFFSSVNLPEIELGVRLRRTQVSSSVSPRLPALISALITVSLSFVLHTLLAGTFAVKLTMDAFLVRLVKVILFLLHTAFLHGTALNTAIFLLIGTLEQLKRI